MEWEGVSGLQYSAASCPLTSEWGEDAQIKAGSRSYLNAGALGVTLRPPASGRGARRAFFGQDILHLRKLCVEVTFSLALLTCGVEPLLTKAKAKKVDSIVLDTLNFFLIVCLLQDGRAVMLAFSSACLLLFSSSTSKGYFLRFPASSGKHSFEFSYSISCLVLCLFQVSSPCLLLEGMAQVFHFSVSWHLGVPLGIFVGLLCTWKKMGLEGRKHIQGLAKCFGREPNGE